MSMSMSTSMCVDADMGRCNRKDDKYRNEQDLTTTTNNLHLQHRISIEKTLAGRLQPPTTTHPQYIQPQTRSNPTHLRPKPSIPLPSTLAPTPRLTTLLTLTTTTASTSSEPRSPPTLQRKRQPGMRRLRPDSLAPVGFVVQDYVAAAAPDVCAHRGERHGVGDELGVLVRYAGTGYTSVCGVGSLPGRCSRVPDTRVDAERRRLLPRLLALLLLARVLCARLRRRGFCGHGACGLRLGGCCWGLVKIMMLGRGRATYPSVDMAGREFWWGSSTKDTLTTSLVGSWFWGVWLAGLWRGCIVIRTRSSTSPSHIGAAFSMRSAWRANVPTLPSNKSATPPEPGRSSWMRIVVIAGGFNTGVSLGKLGAMAETKSLTPVAKVSS